MRKTFVSLSIIAGGLLAVASVHAQDRYDRGGDRGRGGDQITCESHGFHYQTCPVQWRDAQLVRQTSDTQCVKGRTWGVDRSGVWVDRGCAGVFAEAGRRGGRHDNDNGNNDNGNNDNGNNDNGNNDNGGQPGPGWDRDIRFTCESEGYSYKFCRVDVGGGGAVRIDRQVSNTRCVEGSNWGWNRAGVWVDQGCAANFRVDRRWR